MSRYLIDTNILSEPLRPQPDPSAIAYTNGLILVTHNVSDFAGFQDLQIEDWFAS